MRTASIRLPSAARITPLIIVRLGESRLDRNRATDQRGRTAASQLMRNKAQKVKGFRVAGFSIAELPVKTLGLDQIAGTMVAHRRRKLLLPTN